MDVFLSPLSVNLVLGSNITVSRRSKGLSRRRILISTSKEANYGTKKYHTLDNARTMILVERQSFQTYVPYD